MTELHLDYETYSEADISDCGTSRYSRHPSTEVLMVAFAYDDDEPEVFDVSGGERLPKRFLEGLRDPDVTKMAWNAPFEMDITRNVLGEELYPDEWYDIMVLAYTLSFPGSLDKAGTFAGLAEDKKKSSRGKALIRKFCQPQKPTKKAPWTRATRETNPSEWEEFLEYNRQDVVAQRAFKRKFEKWDLPKHEWRNWYLDREINDAGVPINMNVVNNAIKIYEEIYANRIEELKAITGLANPNSNVQLLGWLQRNGYRYLDLKKSHVLAARSEGLDAEPLRVLELRQEVSKASIKKFYALREKVDSDGVLRNGFQFAGAQRTWRWAGRGWQPQNLAKPPKELEDQQEQVVDHVERLSAKRIELLYKNPMDVLSMCVRPVAQAPKGYLFVDSDLNAIENRVLGWIADDQKILDVFRKNQDPYLAFAVYSTGKPYEQLYHEYKVLGDKKARNDNKPPTLGCGYMLSAGKFIVDEATGEETGTGLLGYAKNMGIALTPHQAEHAVKVFRKTFTEVVEFWYAIEKAMKKTIKTGHPTRVGFLTFDMSGPFCRMGLPSGRYLHYYKPSVRMMKKPWGDVGETITYWGLNDKGAWALLTTHPGKITENADQAIARDLLVHGMRLAKKEGIDTRIHVHDQICGLVKEADAEKKLNILKECMSVVPKWAPGLILGAEGTISRVFMKD